jgi:tetrahydromethanopterin S-methyltransferase subunit A
MEWNLIPGKYNVENEENPIAIVTLNSELSFEYEPVAIWGKIMTENLGLTRVLSNILSNPNIRHLIVCGKEVRGHFPGDAFLSLFKNGYEINSGNVSIKDTIAADPRLPIKEDSMEEVYSRLKNQITLINLIGETDLKEISKSVKSCLEKRLKPLDSPFIINFKKTKDAIIIEEDVALHPKIILKYNKIYKR